MKNITIRVVVFLVIVALTFLAVGVCHGRGAQSWLPLGMVLAGLCFSASKRWHIVLTALFGMGVPMFFII